MVLFLVLLALYRLPIIALRNHLVQLIRHTLSILLRIRSLAGGLPVVFMLRLRQSLVPVRVKTTTCLKIRLEGLVVDSIETEDVEMILPVLLVVVACVLLLVLVVVRRF